MTSLPSIVCLWEWNRNRKPYWTLVESFLLDADGRVQSPSKHAIKDREPWSGWMNTKDEDDYDLDPIMGRAVTRWNVSDGVNLIDLNPPEWGDWMSPSFVEEFKKLPNWFLFLEGDLYSGTLREAEKHVKVT